MDKYGRRALYFTLYFIFNLLVLLISAAIATYYQKRPYSGVLMHVLIGGIGPLFFRLDGTIVLSYTFLIISYQYMQLIHNGLDQSVNILQYATGFAVTAFFLSLFDYIMPRYVSKSDDNTTNGNIKKYKQKLINANNEYLQLQTDYQQQQQQQQRQQIIRPISPPSTNQENIFPFGNMTSSFIQRRPQ